jgi:hypothetical protein
LFKCASHYGDRQKALRLTKIEGATRQIEAAIAAFWRGDFDVAITLAGAAEGMIEGKGSDLFSYFRGATKVRQFDDKKQWITVLNQERDWLKHNDEQHAPVLEIECDHAAMMITRAITKCDIKHHLRCKRFWLGL